MKVSSIGAIGLAALLMAVPVGAQKAAPKRPVAAKRTVKRAVPRPTAVQTLAATIWQNSVGADDDLYEACVDSNTKGLLFGLDGFFGKKDFSKGEFETEADFQVRMSNMEGALAGDRNLIVCQYLDDNEDVPFNYDAEKQSFAGSFSSVLRANLDWKKTGTYASKTRMGARATVTAYFGIDYDINMSSALSAATAGCIDASYSKVRFTMPVPIDDAPAVKAHGYLAIIGRLANPFYAREDSTGSPTLDHPSDVTQVTMTATVKPSALYVVMPGGEKIWQCRLDEGRPKPVPIGERTTWVSMDDYPPAARRAGAEGRVAVALEIGVDGRVQSCTVTSSSGNADLDDATCRLIRSRARLRPATDKDGAPVPAGFETAVVWKLG